MSYPVLNSLPKGTILARIKPIETISDRMTLDPDNPILIPIEQAQRMKRRKFSRQFKLVADLALLQGNHVEAL